MTKKWQTVTIVLVGIVGLAVFWLATADSVPKPAPGKAFEYDLSKYSRTDPSMIIADEADPIPLPLQVPAGLAVDGDDRLYVVGDDALLVLGADGTELQRCVLPDGEVMCVAVGPGGDVYVGLRNRVAVFGDLSQPATLWEDMGTNAVITSIAAGDDDVFVADAGNRIIWRYDKQGQRLNSIGARDKAAGIGGFIIPSPYFDVALGTGGSLWVVDPGRHQIQNYTYDGAMRSMWEKASMQIDGFCGCCNPSHMAVRPDGSFVTSEKGFVRVKIYNEIGDLIGVVAGPESFEDGARGLDLAVDSGGRILVLDPQRREVRIFLEREPRAAE